METLICTTCRVPLSSQDDSRLHYKTQFHTYNLKRKYVGLQAVSLEAYQEKQKLSDELAPALPADLKCTCCGNVFPSQKSLNKHVRGKQTVSASVAVVSDITCIFCDDVSENINENIKHMLVKHGFFIPDLDLVKDLAELLKYLQDKVRELFLCLYCNNRANNFQSAKSVQQHMIDKQHCFINTDEDEMEFRRFYALDSSFEVLSSEDEVHLEHYIDLGSQSSETSSFSLIGTKSSRGGIEVLPTGELKLPNGKVIGHKQFKRYYQQIYRPKPVRIQQLLEILGEDKECGEVEEKKEWHENFTGIQEAKLLKQGLKNNMLQPHMRKQIN